MAKYVDGYVIPIHKKHVALYRRMAKDGERVWKKYGALDYKECIGEDLRPKMANAYFPRMLRLKPGETVIFSYVVFKSRKHRDEVNAKVMKDPFMEKYANKPMPFDVKRMAYGGFDVIVGD